MYDIAIHLVLSVFLVVVEGFKPIAFKIGTTTRKSKYVVASYQHFPPSQSNFFSNYSHLKSFGNYEERERENLVLKYSKKFSNM